MREQAQAEELAAGSGLRLGYERRDADAQGKQSRTRAGFAEPPAAATGQRDLRGWEWRYLWEQSRSDALFTLCRNLARLTRSPFLTTATGWR